MARFKLTVEYDGTGFAGWQAQHGRDSIQSMLAEAVFKLTGESPIVIAAGRTDAGVHALGQVVHVDIAKTMKPFNVMQGINFHLCNVTSQIIVTAAEEMPDTFHARFSAVKRSYRYRIINRQARLAIDHNRAWQIHEKLDADAMHESAQILAGHHDFSSFRSSECQSKNPFKTLDRIEVSRNGHEIALYVESRSFLHHQVRNMVGTLRLIGNGKWDGAELQKVLDARDRTKAGATAPACGLYFVNVSY